MMDKQNANSLKKVDKELMPVAWYPERWWDWSMPEDEKNGVQSILTDKR